MPETLVAGGGAARTRRSWRFVTAALALGAEVTGLNLAALVRDGEQSSVHNRSGLASVLEAAMAHTGVLVFRGQGVLSGDDQVRISMLFGAGEMHSTHGEHAKAGNEHIFRLSNKDGEGIVGE